MPSTVEGMNIMAVDKSTGEAVDVSALEDTNTAFDPSRMHLDLTKEEKRRTTALLLAIQAYQNLIIKDAEMYNAISRDQVRNDALKIRPATMDAMVEAALDFDDFISGKLQERIRQARESVAEPKQPERDDPSK